MSHEYDLGRHIQRLQDGNVELRRRLEQAELQIPMLNAAIRQLFTLNYGDNKMLIGDVIYHAGYGIESSSSANGLVVQAALLRSRGLGALLWDMEAYVAFYNSPLTQLESLRSKFAEFDELPPAFRALLAPRVKALVERFCSEVLPR